MTKSNFFSHEILKWLTGQANYLDDGLITPKAALYQVAPTSAGGGTECSYSGYARVSLASKFGSPGSKEVASNALITFATPSATPSGSPSAVAVGIFDSAGTPNFLTFELLANSIPIVAGTPLQFAASDFIIQES